MSRPPITPRPRAPLPRPEMHLETIPGVRAVHPFTSASTFGHTLPEGTRLQEFKVMGLVGEGGFGIVYLAYDPSLDRHVAIKEYMPASLASRTSNAMTIAPRAERHRETFRAGLKSFINEARLLARFDHPALLKVYRFWEDNGTAYMVMPYYEGPTLRHALGLLKAPPSEAALRHWLHPLLDALAVLHAEHCYHRDIAPDNILLTDEGPLLLDFGAARRVVGDMTHALTVMLKPGYAPIEQYGESPDMRQGPWTDLYALACVVSYAITGEPPPSSVERLMGDRRRPLVETAAGLYSPGFLAAIDQALSVQPQDRPQDVAAFRALLDAAAPSALDGAAPHTVPADLALPLEMPAVARTAPAHDAGSAGEAPARRTRRVGAIAGTIALASVISLTIAAGWWRSGDDTPGDTPSAGGTRSASPAAGSATAPHTAPHTNPPTTTRPSAAARTAPAATSAAATRRAPSPAPSPAHSPAPPLAAPRKADARPTSAPAPAPATAAREPTARCIDMLQKASLGTLDADEEQFLKKECQ